MKQLHTPSAFAVGPATHTQSSLTRDGITSGSLSGSRWGLRGQEDSRCRLKTVFDLEDSFSTGNGALGRGGRMSGRKAFVELSTAYGEVALGRQYELLDGLIDGYDPVNFNPSYLAKPVRYLARLSRVTFAALYSTDLGLKISNGAQMRGQSKVGRGCSLALRARGPRNVAVAYDQVRVNIGARRLNVRNSATLQSSLLYWLVAPQANARLIFSSSGYQKPVCGFGQSVVSGVLLANYFVSKRSNVYANVRYFSSPNGPNDGAPALGDVTMGGNQTCAMVGIEQTC